MPRILPFCLLATLEEQLFTHKYVIPPCFTYGVVFRILDHTSSRLKHQLDS